MRREFPELDPTRVTVSEEVRARHQAAISAEIASVARSRSRPRRLLAIALAAVLLVPVVALAAEKSVPGDFLYPAKRTVEPVFGIFDDQFVADHRVDEVERLIARDAPIDVVDRHIDRARLEVEEFPELSYRLDQAIRKRHSDANPPPGDREDIATTPDRRTTSTTVAIRPTTSLPQDTTSTSAPSRDAGSDERG